MNNFFTLILWPYSQQFIGHKDCLFYAGETNREFDGEKSQGIFVPKEILDDMTAEELNKLTDGIEDEYIGIDATDSYTKGRIGLYYDESDEDGLIFIPKEEKA